MAWINVPNLVSYLNQTPIFEWYVVWCGSKNEYQNYNVCLQEIGLRAQNVITILSSIVSMIKEDLYNHFVSLRIFILIMNKIIIRTPKLIWGKRLWPWFGIANNQYYWSWISYLCVSYPKRNGLVGKSSHLRPHLLFRCREHVHDQLPLFLFMMSSLITCNEGSWWPLRS